MKEVVLQVFVGFCVSMLIFACHVSNSSSETGFVIKGNIAGLEDSIIYFSRPGDRLDQFIIDSAYVKNGRFEYWGNVSQPVVYYMYRSFIKYPSQQGLNFFVENGHITINGVSDSLKYATVQGSAIQEQYDSFKESTRCLTKSIDSLNKLYMQYNHSKDTANERKVSKEMNLLVRDQLIIQKRFVKTHPHSYVSVYLLYGYLGAQQTPEHLAQLLYSLDAIRQHSLYGKLISEEIHWDTIGLLNHRAFNFEFTDLNGEKCSIENQRGKYVLLDFWASWCAPCRAENKELRNIWKKYKYKNFVIIGIADDDKSAKKWKEAIKKDKIGSWINILRGSETDQDINKLYSIQTIPTQILIDPQGIIIGRYNGNNEKEFDKKLFKIFK